MYDFLAFLSGVILAVMIQLNGGLSEKFGVYHAAWFIHMIGVGFAAVLLLTRKEFSKVFQKVPLWMYLGGVIGVLTTVFNNLAFSKISLTSIIALGLFAQLVLSCLIDTFGWFGMKKCGKNMFCVPGLLLSLVGIVIMLETSVLNGWLYVAVSLGAGITVVLSRTVNAHLAERVGSLQGSFLNHLCGLPCCFLLAMLIPETAVESGGYWWIWCGGILGVTIVGMFNVIVPKIPAYRLTLLSFCGQMFCGILLDVGMGGGINWREFGAGLLVAAGIAVSHMVSFYKTRK